MVVAVGEVTVGGVTAWVGLLRGWVAVLAGLLFSASKAQLGFGGKIKRDPVWEAGVITGIT